MKPPTVYTVYMALAALPVGERWAATHRAYMWANESRRVVHPRWWSDWDFLGAWILGFMDGLSLGERR